MAIKKPLRLEVKYTFVISRPTLPYQQNSASSYRNKDKKTLP